MRRDLTNEEDLQELRKKIKASFRATTGQLEGWEDCAQEIIFKWTKKDSKQTIEQAVIDYLRTYSGDKRDKSYESRAKLRAATSKSLAVISDDSNSSIENKILVKQIYQESDHWERAIMILFYELGFTLEEIGYLFDRTETMIAKNIKEITKRISKRIG